MLLVKYQMGTRGAENCPTLTIQHKSGGLHHLSKHCNNYLFSELCWGKAIVAYTKPLLQKKEKSDRLTGERDNIKFMDLRLILVCLSLRKRRTTASSLEPELPCASSNAFLRKLSL